MNTMNYECAVRLCRADTLIYTGKAEKVNHASARDTYVDVYECGTCKRERHVVWDDARKKLNAGNTGEAENQANAGKKAD